MNDPQNSTLNSALPFDYISVFSWNIYKENCTNWDTDLLLYGKNADIIFLQEALLTRELQQVLQKNRLHWNLNSAFRYKGKDTGVLIASSVPSTGSCGLRQNEPIIQLPKTTLIQKYSIQGSSDKLLAVNVHGINITLGLHAYQAQMDAMRMILKQHDGPIILAGDFNNWSEERTQIIMEFAGALALQRLNFEKGGRTLFWGEPVDQIFYRGLHLVSQSVISVLTSDHNPIQAVFSPIRMSPTTH